MEAKTVWPWRESVSAKSLPNPVLEPVMRMTWFEAMRPPLQVGMMRLMEGASKVQFRMEDKDRIRESKGEGLNSATV